MTGSPNPDCVIAPTDLGLAAGGDEKQRRDRADAERGGEFLLLFGIHLVDVNAVAVLGSQLFQNRGECLAGAAPRCVEVDERQMYFSLTEKGRVLLGSINCEEIETPELLKTLFGE